MGGERNKVGRSRYWGLGLGLALWWTALVAAAGASTTTEFALPTAFNVPVGITAGPDGALWFTRMGGHTIGRITPAGAITEFPLPTANSFGSAGITAGPDGALWFTEQGGNQIGRITTDGTITEFGLPVFDGGFTNAITAGPDGSLWFTEYRGNKIGRITTAGTITEFSLLTPGINPRGITAGPDGALWFTRGSSIGRITTAGTITEFAIPTGGSGGSITAGPDGALWFTQSSSIGRITTAGTITEFAIPTGGGGGSITAGPDGALWFTQGSSIGRITTSGTITEFPIPTASSEPHGITPGPDGALWFTESNANKIGRITTYPDRTLAAAVLPPIRSVELGNAATAFATIINLGSDMATDCSLMPAMSLAATFSYQTTDSRTNALTGTPNTPVDIPAGQTQTFVFAVTPTSPFAPTNVQLTFACTNTDPAPITAGLNTFLLSASATPVTDIVALVVTPTDDGIVTFASLGVFAVATVNAGTGGQITVSADTGAASLPVSLALCETEPGTGACLAPPTPTVTTQIDANATPTFAVFVTGNGPIPFAPATNRIFVRFTDSERVVRGATSVAVHALGEFSFGASPSSQTVLVGTSASYTVTLAALNGYSSAVNLSVSGLPDGASVTFSPNPVTPTPGGATSTLHVTIGATTPAGTYSLTITGTGTDAAAAAHTTTVAIQVSSDVFLSVGVSGSGSVTSSPGGINCGRTCVATFAPGTTVTLTAQGQSSTFDGWSGDCASAGTHATCTLVMTTNKYAGTSFSTAGSGGPGGYCSPYMLFCGIELNFTFPPIRLF